MYRKEVGVVGGGCVIPVPERARGPHVHNGVHHEEGRGPHVHETVAILLRLHESKIVEG